MNQGSRFRRISLHRVVFSFLRNSELNDFRKFLFYMHLKFFSLFGKSSLCEMFLIKCCFIYLYIVCVALVAYCEKCFFADITPFHLS